MASTKKASRPARRAKAAEPAASARERILEAARKLFAERGFDATATKAIADEAGVPTGLVFYHFESKEALLDELFKGEILPDVIEKTLETAADEPPETVLRTVALRLLQWLHEHDDHARLFFKEITSHRSLAARLRASRRRSIGAVAAYLERAAHRGQLPGVNVTVAAQVFISSILLAAIFDREASINAYVRDLVALITCRRARR